MCGIAGEISLSTGSRTDLERAHRMIRAILHRGPDDVGGWQDRASRAALLHSRLSIVDLKGGHQPMHATEGNVTVVFNGEIYGYKAWRSELEASGYRFHTHSDTEVLLALYLRHGPDFVEKIEGEFAFVIYDADRRRTLVARDRFGVKPLFYSIRDDVLLFGSEIKSLLAHPLVERRIDPDVMHRRVHGVLLPDETLFDGIRPVQPGSFMLIDADGRIRSGRHAELDPELAGSSTLTRPQAEEAFDAALSAAIGDRLHGDVDIGIYLSGGVDSNLVGAMMREHSGTSHHAFTIGFTDPGYGEGGKAAKAAELFGFEHHVEPIGDNELVEHFQRSLWHAESNVVNTHGTAKMRLSRRAAEQVKVVLVGEGADELHGGYAYYRHAALLQAVGDKSNRAALKAFLADNGAEDGVLSLASRNRRNRLAGASSLGIPYAAQRASVFEFLLDGVLDGDLVAAARPNPAGQLLDWLDAYNPRARRLDDMTLSRFTSALTDLPNYNLAYLGDRSEMANSIEGRVPFLDKRVVDLLWSLPNDFHFDGSHTKPLARAALARRMPQDVADRYKRMFVAPATTNAGLFEGEMAERWLSTEAVKAAGVFRPGWVHSLRQLYRVLPQGVSFRRVLESFLMTVLSAHMLDEMFVRNFDSYSDRFTLGYAGGLGEPSFRQPLAAVE